MAETRNRKNSELADLETKVLYSNSFQSSIALIFAALTIGFLSYSLFYENRRDLFSLQLWTSSAVAACLIRLSFALIYRKRTSLIRTELWRYIFYVTLALTALAFGSSVFIVAAVESPGFTTFIILILGGLSAASIGTLATSRTAFAIFNLLLLLPYSLCLLRHKDFYMQTSGGLVIIFLIVIFITAIRVNRTLSRSLMLKIENDTIIDRLSQSEEKFSKSFYSGIAPMVMLSIKEGIVIDINDSMLQLMGYEKEEVIGKTPYELELTDRPEVVIEIISETAKTGRLSDKQIVLKTKDGSLKHCLLTIERFRLENSLIALAMLRDFTERIEYEKKLELERDRAEQAASAKSKFLAVMSHEIRTPMNSIIGMTNLALMSEKTEEIEDYLQVVRDSADYLLTLINDILDLSRIEAGKISIEPVDMNIHMMIRNIHRTMELMAMSRKITLTYEIDKDIPLYIKAPPERIRQILYNLVGNAIKFTNAGGVTIRVSKSGGKGYNTDQPGDYLEIAVQDTGIGIPPDRLESIFESFTQADSSIFRSYGGTGLGLTISKQLISLMNGDIGVKSIVGEGSTFSFIIPLVEGRKPVSDTELFTPSGSGEKRKILVAEDNLMNQRLISAYIEKLGHTHRIAEDGEKAVEMLRQEDFDLILMDLEMPVLNGLESAEKIRRGEAGEAKSTIPIYAMSAHIQDTIKELCYSQGFAGYLTKPVNLKSLKRILG